MQAFYDRNVVDRRLQELFGFLWIFVSMLLTVEARKGTGSYNKLAEEVIAEWECCGRAVVTSNQA